MAFHLGLPKFWSVSLCCASAALRLLWPAGVPRGPPRHFQHFALSSIFTPCLLALLQGSSRHRAPPQNFEPSQAEPSKPCRRASHTRAHEGKGNKKHFEHFITYRPFGKTSAPLRKMSPWLSPGAFKVEARTCPQNYDDSLLGLPRPCLRKTRRFHWRAPPLILAEMLEKTKEVW